MKLKLSFIDCHKDALRFMYYYWMWYKPGFDPYLFNATLLSKSLLYYSQN